MANNTKEIQQGQQLTWSETDTFTLTGVEFASLHNALQAIMSTPAYREDYDRAKNTLSIGQMFEITNKKLQEGVEAGFVKASEPQKEGGNTIPLGKQPVEPEVHTMD